MSQNPVTAQPGSLSDYYSATQLRADRWSSLRETTERLARDHAGGKATARHVSAALNLLESLARSKCTGPFQVTRHSNISGGC